MAHDGIQLTKGIVKLHFHFISSQPFEVLVILKFHDHSVRLLYQDLSLLTVFFHLMRCLWQFRLNSRMMFAIHVSFSSIQIIFDNSLKCTLHLKYVLFLAHLIKWGLHLKYLPVLEECFFPDSYYCKYRGRNWFASSPQHVQT